MMHQFFCISCDDYTSGEFVGDYSTDCYPRCVEKVASVVRRVKIHQDAINFVWP